MLILGIESSCDETSIAFLEGEIVPGLDFYEQLNRFTVLGSLISSQIQSQKKYGGVVPELGARMHAENIHILFFQTLQECLPGFHFDLQNLVLTEEAKDFLRRLEYIFVTTEPGLISALRVGLEFAKTVQFFCEQELGKRIEIVKVNHLRGHLASCFYGMKELKNEEMKELFPHLHLLVSGGNSQIIFIKSWQDWQVVGQTLDDAAGECLDKVGRMLGFEYPGGVKIAQTAGLEFENPMKLPIGMAKSQDLNFSFSGLKTAARYFLQKAEIAGYEFEKPLTQDEVLFLTQGIETPGLQYPKLHFIKQVCISVQTVVVQQLAAKFEKAILEFSAQSIGLSGGVSANSLLRREINKLHENPVLLPNLSLTGDNAVMIALAGIATKFGEFGKK
jgi:N6-L-threonylcarbamoyladenine synthase